MTTPRLQTVKITAIHEYTPKGSTRALLELSGQPSHGRHGSDGPIGYTHDRAVQDRLLCAQQGTGYVTLGLVPGALGQRIVSVEEVEAL